MNMLKYQFRRQKWQFNGNKPHVTHKRKQSANIPYKMSMPHTNIGKLANNEKEIFTRSGHDYEYDKPSEELWSKLSNMYIDNTYKKDEKKLTTAKEI